MTRRRTNTSVQKVNSCHYFRGERQNKSWYIERRLKHAMHVRSRQNVQIAKAGGISFVHFFKQELDRARAYQQTQAYQKAIRKRSVWVEPLFGEAKQFHRLRRFRLRGLEKVNIEGLMVASRTKLQKANQTGLCWAFFFV